MVPASSQPYEATEGTSKKKCRENRPERGAVGMPGEEFRWNARRGVPLKCPERDASVIYRGPVPIEDFTSSRQEKR